MRWNVQQKYFVLLSFSISGFIFYNKHEHEHEIYLIFWRRPYSCSNSKLRSEDGRLQAPRRSYRHWKKYKIVKNILAVYIMQSMRGGGWKKKLKWGWEKDENSPRTLHLYSMYVFFNSNPRYAI